MKKLSERKKQKKYWIKKNDKLWSEIIHMKGKCEICGKIQTLNAHHLFVKREVKATRWNLKNGVLLCYYHHMEAHRNPVMFIDELKYVWGVDKFEQLKSEVIQMTWENKKQTASDYEAINIALREWIEDKK